MRTIFPIWLLGKWRPEPGAMCLGKNRRGDGRSYRYWYLKAKANSKRRKTRVCMLAECYREDGHLRGEWGHNAAHKRQTKEERSDD